MPNLYPIGTLAINNRLAPECMNREGEIVKYCEEQCCDIQTGEKIVSGHYTLKRELNSCNQCEEIYDLNLCESDLTPV